MDSTDKRPLPDPWLFDSEALLRELDRCRETVLQIPITNPNATHFGIELAVCAIWNLTENLRYLLPVTTATHTSFIDEDSFGQA
jgi:hypothetical protein